MSLPARCSPPRPLRCLLHAGRDALGRLDGSHGRRRDGVYDAATAPQQPRAELCRARGGGARGAEPRRRGGPEAGAANKLCRDSCDHDRGRVQERAEPARESPARLAPPPVARRGEGGRCVPRRRATAWRPSVLASVLGVGYAAYLFVWLAVALQFLLLVYLVYRRMRIACIGRGARRARGGGGGCKGQGRRGCPERLSAGRRVYLSRGTCALPHPHWLCLCGIV